ncbi:hypothetical protein DRQ09_01690 [candidate division KSB1 bacterium]|nr:MAG: hypothetical protein DRQ09_01690 [candidate division KSB1 bacterium]
MKKYKKSTDLSWLDELNQAQRKAVTAYQGPSLVIAGAGSGKTKVIIYRIAYLIKVCKVTSQKILALTFTNKAANEMKSRLENFLSLSVKDIWMGTFHSIFAKILRIEGNKLGFTRNFTIYDESDQHRFIKEIIEYSGLVNKNYDPEIIKNIISKCKNKLISPDEYIESAETDFEKDIGKIYSIYNNKLWKNNALDFDDLILKPIELFSKYKDVLNKYQNKFHYILVDEYQDTNKAQHKLLKLLAEKNRNICVVGDDDQAIYSWRGAELSNIIDFEKDYPDVKIFKLEQNYRSTKNILNFAQEIVCKNKLRREKNLWTEKEEGCKINLVSLYSDKDESRFIVDKIKEEIFKNKKKLREISVFYRINSQSRTIEERLQKNNIPYIIVGGIRFYERKEIKDILAYLKIIANPRDEISLLRIINYPHRGIGKATLEKVKSFARKKGIELYRALKNSSRIQNLDKRKKTNILSFYKLIEKYRELKDKLSLTELTRCLLDETGIISLFKEEGSRESIERIENIMEFLSAISEFSRTSEKPTLENYLQEISLITDIDMWNDAEEAVSLMTLHSAKGLEFPVVFIVGVEDNLIPYIKRLENEEELEEERRLFYVGCTRAKEKLYITYAKIRNRFGNETVSLPSRFLNDIDMNLVNIIEMESSSRNDIEYRRKKEITVPKAEESFEKGQLVKHPTFGIGEIIEKSGEGEELRLLVTFEGNITKKLLVKYARLELLH